MADTVMTYLVMAYPAMACVETSHKLDGSEPSVTSLTSVLLPPSLHSRSSHSRLVGTDDGSMLGTAVRCCVGLVVVGLLVGSELGSAVGICVGVRVGVGERLGTLVGAAVGTRLGEGVGVGVGTCAHVANGQTGRWTDGSTDGWMDGRTGRIDGSMDPPIHRGKQHLCWRRRH